MRGGGARYSLFVSVLDSNILPLLATGTLTAAEIITTLGLDPARGRKWLHLLSLTGLVGVVNQGDATRYYLSQRIAAMFGPDGVSGWFHREFLRYYRAASYHGMTNLMGTLRGAPVEHAVRYPPRPKPTSSCFTNGCATPRSSRSQPSKRISIFHIPGGS